MMPKYSDGFKKAAVMVAEKTDTKFAAYLLEVSPATIYRWRKEMLIRNISNVKTFIISISMI